MSTIAPLKSRRALIKTSREAISRWFVGSSNRRRPAGSISINAKARRARSPPESIFTFFANHLRERGMHPDRSVPPARPPDLLPSPPWLLSRSVHRPTPPTDVGQSTRNGLCDPVRSYLDPTAVHRQAA